MNRRSLRHSLRCYHWFFIWCTFQILLIAGILRRGFLPGNTLWVELIATIIFGYVFLIDMSTRIWWDYDRVYWHDLGAFSVRPLRRSLHIAELTSVRSAFRSVANYAPAKPFDSIVLSGLGEPIQIFPSFHRREELEELLRLLYEKQPEAFSDPKVIEFLNGGFTDWWRYRR